MNDDISKLEELLNPSALVKTEPDKVPGKWKVKLSDTIKPTGKKYSIDIKNVPNNTLVIKVDTFSPGTIINCHDNKGFRECVDYILVNKRKTVFVELKHGKKINAENIMEQFKGAQCLMDYLISIGEQFFSNKSEFLEKTSKNQHFVVIVIADSKIPETPAGQKRQSNGSPEKMAGIIKGNNDSLDYNQLFYRYIFTDGAAS